MDRIIRPRMVVLPDSAQVPEQNLLHPPPTRFTHEVKVEQPYYYTMPARKAQPVGVLAAGTKVVLMHCDKAFCHVADGRGLYVVTAFAGLRPLRTQPKRSGPRR